MADGGSNAEAISPPAGTGNAPGLGEAFALDLNTGQGGYAVPLTLPDGVAGFSPALRLEYHHGGGPGCFGLGWALPVRTIDLRLDYGVPGTAAEVFTDGDRELADVSDGEFRAVRESDFTRYRRVGDGWEVTERTGVIHRLGMDPAAQLADPAHPDRVISWLLQSSADLSGNTVSYTWQIDDGAAYLAAVSYASYTVALQYEPRPDVIRSGRAGFGQAMSRRCTAVDLLVEDTGGRRTVRRWTLGYRQAAFSGVSLLAEVQLTSFGPAAAGGPAGTPGATAPATGDVVRPPQRFSYREPDPSRWHAAFAATADGSPPPPMTDPRSLLTPLGDGPVPGVLQVTGGRFLYWPGTGTGGFGPPRPLTAVPRVTTLQGSEVQLLDIDGDAQIDMLVGGGDHDVTGFYRGDGVGGFAEFVPYPASRRGTPLGGAGQNGDGLPSAAAVRVADVDGDGRVDVLASVGRGYAWWRNEAADGWDDPRAVPPGDGISGPDADLADPLVRMADMTGDGLPDLVRIRSGAVVYWPNLGDGQFGAAVLMTGSPRTPAVATPSALSLADVDGDGCADLIQVDGTGVTVWPNLSGGGFGPPVRDPLVPAPIPGTVVPAAMTDDAAAGLVWCSQRNGAAAYVRYDLGSSCYELTGVDNGAGLVSQIDYTTAGAEQRRDANAGRPWTRPLPFPLTVVAGTSETDTITGQRSESRYRYHDAHYDDRTRTFEGFAEVEKIEAGDSSRPDCRTVFFYRVAEDRQPGNGPEAAALNRMLRRVEVYAEDGTPQAALPLSVEESDHGLTVLGTGPDGRQRVLVTVTSTSKQVTERTGDSRTEEHSYSYDAFGNVTRDAQACTGTLSGVTQPPQTLDTDVTYATDEAGNIFDRAARISRHDGSVLVMETQRYYDGPDFTGLPLGQPGRGLLTRELRWALTKTDFEAHYAGMDATALGYQEGTDADGRAGLFAPAERNRYDTQGRKTGQQSPTGAVTAIGYDPSGLFRAVETTPIGTTTSVFDLAVGKATQITGADGTVAHLRYDAQGRLTSVALPGDDLSLPTRSYSYDDSTLPSVVRVEMRLQSGAAATALTAVYFDGRMQEVQRRVAMDDSRFVVSGHVTRNPWGDVAAEFEPTFAATADYAVPDLTGQPSRQLSFDVLGRPVRTVDYGGGISTAVYTPFSISTADADDNDASAANVARGQFGTVRVDHMNVAQHRVRTEEQGGVGPVVTTFEPDALGRLVAHGDDLGEVQRSVFDGLGNRLSTQHREAGGRQCFYDAQSRMVRTVDGAGHDIAAGFDAVDRITQLTADGAVRETYQYDDLASNGFGRLRQVTYPGGAQRFGYDPQGRLTSQAYAFDGIAADNVFGFGYDAQGRRTSVTYPDGSTVTQDLYANGLPRRVAGFADLIDYDPRMLLTTISYPSGAATTVTSTPGAGRVAHQRTAGPNGVVLDDQAFGYDAMWRVLSVTHAEPGNATVTTYDYDPLYQLRQVADDPGGGAEPVTTAYSYVRSRLLSGNGESGLTLHYDDAAHPGRASQISGGPADLAVSYDGNGNMTTLPGRTLGFGPKNQLETVTRDDGTVVTYVYDHTGQRIRKQVRRGLDVTDTLLLGPLAEVRNGQLACYVVLGTSRIALVTMGVTMWIHTDPLGSATFYTDAKGTQVARIAYRAFGNAGAIKGTPWAQVFALHEFDSDAGLYYLRRRWYAADLGCFVSPDAVYLFKPERGTDHPATLSLYTYAANDPANNVDPDGGSFWSVVGGIVGVVVGIVVAVVVIVAFASGIGIGLLFLAGLVLAVTAGYILASANQGNWFGELMKGFLIGLNAGMNMTFLAAMGLGWIGLAIGVLDALSVFDTVRHNSVYQGILGWSNWLTPMSWFVLALGAAFFVLNILGALFTLNKVSALKITYIHMDWATGSIVMKGGWISNLNSYHTAFDMGNFIYVDRQNTDPGDDVPHESGHSLSLAAFGSIVHMVGFVDEFLFNGGDAWTERMADSHAHKGTDHTWS